MVSQNGDIFLFHGKIEYKKIQLLDKSLKIDTFIQNINPDWAVVFVHILTSLRYSV